MTKTTWCEEHNAQTTHSHLQAIGWVCVRCLHIYFAIHERFVDFARINAENLAEMHAPLSALSDECAPCEQCGSTVASDVLILGDPSVGLPDSGARLCPPCANE